MGSYVRRDPRRDADHCCCTSEGGGNPPECIEPVIDSAEPADGVVDVLYSHQYSSGGSVPITWSVTSGSLPAGLTLDPDTGVLSGIPTTATVYNWTVTAYNNCESGEDSQPTTMEITNDAPPSSDLLYWGEWNAALPGTFTEANILTGLANGDIPGGPRSVDPATVVVLGVITLEFPETTAETYRVLVVPTGYLTSLEQPPGDDAILNPAVNTVYQAPLTVAGQSSDVYVLAENTFGPLLVVDNTQLLAIL
jgi:hypothetical protein